MQNNMISTLWAVRCLHKVSGYCPTVGEVAKVAGISRPTAYRHLQHLIDTGNVELIESKKGSRKWKVRESELGRDLLSLSGRL